MVRKPRKRISGLELQRFIYLISPNIIKKNFYKSFEKVLLFGNVKYFQLRLKKNNKANIIKIGNNVRQISKKYNVKLIINDDFNSCLKIKADGCHMGQLDGSIMIARKKLKREILGLTCHNSITLAKKAVKQNVDYIAFGSFFKSRLKPKAKKASYDVLKKAKKIIKKPIVVIGGINNKNYKKLLNYGANYIAISSYIWDNPNLKPEIAIRRFK